MGAQRPLVAADRELPAAHRYLVARTVKLFSGATQLEPHLAQSGSVSGTTAGVTGGSRPPGHGEGTAVQVLLDLSPGPAGGPAPDRGVGEGVRPGPGHVSVCNFTRLCVCV